MITPIRLLIIPLAFIFALNPVPLAAQSLGKDREIEPVWRQALGGTVLGPPSVQGETVAMVLDGGNVKTYTLQGSLLSDYFARGRLTPFITRSPEGTSYICRTNGTLIALNRVGREIWRRRLDTPLSAPVIIGWDGRLFVCASNRIACYTASGYLLWFQRLDHPLAFPPSLDRAGGLLAVLSSGDLLEIDPFGTIRSRRLGAPPVLAISVDLPSMDRSSIDLPSMDRSSIDLPSVELPSIDRSSVDLPSMELSSVGLPQAGSSGARPEPGILVLYENGTGEILKTGTAERSGEPAFPLPALGGVPVAAITRGSQAAIALASGQVVLLSIEDGAITWTRDSRVRLESGERPGMIFDERGICLLARQGGAGFTLEGGVRWFLELQGAATVPAFSDEGVLYSGGTDWILNAYQLEEDTVVRQPGGTEQRYGTGTPRSPSWVEYQSLLSDDTVRSRLEYINRRILAGQVGAEEREFTAYLMNVAERQGNPNGGPLQPLVQVRYRREALRLLGYLGSQETIPFLAALYSREKEPIVKAAAAGAVGTIGVDPQGLALRAFSAQIGSSANQDEQVLMAVAGATGAVCRFSGPPLSETGIRILVILGADNQPRVVREKAREELATLR